VKSSCVRALAVGPAPIRIRSAADLRAHRAEHGIGHTVEQAALAGLVADGLGWAFAGGYEAALSRLDPEGMRGSVLGGLCATEEGGGHPRAIQSVLTAREGGYLLSGKKSWVTLGSDADVLLVVASVGQEAGRNRLRVARVPLQREGVRIQETPPLPFVSEIAHAKAIFESVAVAESELLPGDGYDDVLKPFRTIEDVHVMASSLGWGIGVARASEWPRAWIDEAIALVALFCAIGDAPALAPETHVVLAGAQAVATRLMDGAPWSKSGDALRSRWERDRPLVNVAGNVRAARLEAAWKALAGGGSSTA
jgi:hypothetical protein